MILRDHLDPGKCTTLLNYPDMAYYEKVVRQGINGTINIVYPGTISHHHGIDIAIQAIPFIKKNGVKVKLRIYGKNTKNRYNDHLQSLMKELDVADDVEFLEPVHREELYRIYSRSDIGIVPKRDGVFSGEAFSTKIYDFMASGLPVVASRTKIDEYYFDDSMISFFEPGNYEEMAKRVVDVYADQKKAGEMVDKCKRYIDDNTWMKKKSMYTTVVDRLNRVGSREEPSMIRS
jgi:glycosyltransferase involved in cell wall biosynthesis